MRSAAIPAWQALPGTGPCSLLKGRPGRAAPLLGVRCSTAQSFPAQHVIATVIRDRLRGMTAQQPSFLRLSFPPLKCKGQHVSRGLGSYGAQSVFPCEECGFSWTEASFLVNNLYENESQQFSGQRLHRCCPDKRPRVTKPRTGLA